MTKQQFINGLKVGAAPVVLGLALVSAPAFAQTTDSSSQDASQAADQTAPAPEIIVTGSRIQSPNMQSVSPITTVTSQDISLSGTTRTEDLLNSLPQVVAGQSSALANGATGTATVDLRGLGPSRTLVLINGRRLMTGDPNSTSSAADLNFIPSSLVKRVDVLTGGASATYGADAVAGVVNFVMDTDFTGFRLDTNYGIYNHNNRNSLIRPLLDAKTAAGVSGYGYPDGTTTDGAQFDTTASFGAALDGDRGHVTAYFGYRKANPVLQSRRDYSACTIQGSKSSPSTLACGGSATSPSGNALYFVPGNVSSSTIGALGPGTIDTGTYGLYNYAPLNYFQRPDRRYTAGAFADYEITPAIHPYMEFMFMDDETKAQIAPSGDFGNTLTINCDNPLMSGAQSSVLCQDSNLINGHLGTFPLAEGAPYNTNPGAAPLTYYDPSTGDPYNIAYFQPLRRNVEGGPRVADLQHTAYRAVLGSRGDLGKAWSYDAYYQYGRTNYQQTYYNEFSVARLTNALDAVLAPSTYTGNNYVTNSAGQKVICRSTAAGTDANCVPYDIFGGTPSAASLAYVNGTGFIKGYTSEQIESATLTGSLGEYGIKSPWADDGVNVALGAEHRVEKLQLTPDNEFETGDLSGQGAPTKFTQGSYNVTEVFGELNVPIVHDSFIYDLSFDGGYRYSHYKISNGRTFNTNTYKLNLNFAPISDIKIRGGYNRAVRVPNIEELFAPQIVALDGVSDPCAAQSSVSANCALQGVAGGTPANPAAQYNGLIGGNPDLNPEKSTTKSLGIVLQPHWVPNLMLSVDYFDIKVKDAIQQFGADAIVASCTTTGNPTACDLIHRNAAGSLWLTSDGYVTDINHNVGSVKTTGFEFNGSYAHELGGIGSLSLSFVGTALDKFKTDNGLTDVYDCAGYYGPTCGNPLPKWRHKLRATFRTPGGIGLSAQWRYLSSVKVEYLNPSSTLNSSLIYPQDAKIGAQSYFDVTLTADLGEHLSWRLGANNVLDRQPPLVTSSSTNSGCASVVCNGNTYPGTYDALGRYIFTGITLNF
ncbi:TonB-dependent receptor domain-containing protein [Hephaestia mangrovi]|uniref:TonB-dependent receptor domain-containing protein n=1 Tax=Hephaestia mangrovi TaxID=2873268 RepID=UPI001CA6247A|nr:TonB-dependent receptor [Hephaestia mangrovi]MBY8828086.1 TonB-dependent receptor [Hephaestia mangrovi]